MCFARDNERLVVNWIRSHNIAQMMVSMGVFLFESHGSDCSADVVSKTL